MKRNQKNVITRRNLTQGKQLTKHAQKLITAFMKTYVDDWILNEYACPGDEPGCESIAITDKLVTTKEEVKTKCMYIRHTWVYIRTTATAKSGIGRWTKIINCSIICGRSYNTWSTHAAPIAVRRRSLSTSTHNVNETKVNFEKSQSGAKWYGNNANGRRKHKRGTHVNDKLWWERNKKTTTVGQNQ